VGSTPRIDVDTGRRELLRDTRDVSQNSTQPTQPTHTLHTLPTTRRKLAGERSSPRARRRLTSHFDITSHPSPVGCPSSLFRRALPSLITPSALHVARARLMSQQNFFARAGHVAQVLPAFRSSPTITNLLLLASAVTHPRSIRPRSSPQQSISPRALHSSPSLAALFQQT
jgi:hypothetical protein